MARSRFAILEAAANDVLTSKGTGDGEDGWSDGLNSGFWCVGCLQFRDLAGWPLTRSGSSEVVQVNVELGSIDDCLK